MKERTIWTSVTDTSQEAIRAYRDEYGGLANMTDRDVIDRIYEDTERWHSVEAVELQVPVGYPILVIADLGLWFGRRSAVRIIHAKTIADILTTHCGDFVTYYADAYNVRCKDTHHDGTNYYLFRELRGTEEKCRPLISAVMNQEAVSRALLNRYSRSILPYVADIYGWPVSGRRKKVMA